MYKIKDLKKRKKKERVIFDPLHVPSQFTSPIFSPSESLMPFSSLFVYESPNIINHSIISLFCFQFSSKATLAHHQIVRNIQRETTLPI